MDWKFETHRGKGEYFLVENRQPVGFDAGLPACGVIVYHVDERVTSTNEANADDTHRLVDVEEADGHDADGRLPLPGLRRRRLPRLERSRRLQRRDAATGDALLRAPVGGGDARRRRLRRRR